jgi:hypothetical protein
VVQEANKKANEIVKTQGKTKTHEEEKNEAAETLKKEEEAAS